MVSSSTETAGSNSSSQRLVVRREMDPLLSSRFSVGDDFAMFAAS